MSQTYLASRGCVFVVPSPGQGGGVGLYAIKGFPQSSAQAPILIQGVEINDTDIVMPVATLNNFKVLYSFGQDIGNAAIFGEVLLGPGGSSAQGLTSVLSWFQSNRVSKSSQPVSLSTPGNNTYKVYITGLFIGRADAELNIQPFAVSGIIAQPGQNNGS
jgi:hypothetical protein